MHTCVVFFFQAEDGIRDYKVTGVQTCALPILQEFADMLSAIALAAGDNKISKPEAKNIRARWEELKQVTELFVHCCESGNFSEIREKAEKEAAQLRAKAAA